MEEYMNIWKVALLVEDLDSSLDFYSNTLGMKIVQRKAKSVHLDAGAIRLELIAKEVFQGEERLGKPGVHHLSFRVDDIEKKAEELKLEGVKFIKDPIDRGGGLRIAFFDGQNNVNLQLYELKE